MNKKNMMRDFINIINNRRLMTSFIKNIFGYKNFFGYNYIFRSTDKDNELIIDIYDNVTENRFNRYIFNFDNCNYTYEKKLIDNIHIHYISVLNVKDNDNNLIKLAFLFNLEKDKMIEYAKTFLDKEFIITIKDIIK